MNSFSNLCLKGKKYEFKYRLPAPDKHKPLPYISNNTIRLQIWTGISQHIYIYSFSNMTYSNARLVDSL